MAVDSDIIAETLRNARRELLRRRANNHWEGRLASSALATATAVVALSLIDRHTDAAQGATTGGYRSLVEGGLRWIIEHQNADGGWGDTPSSVSNISATVLCWAACTCGAGDDNRRAVAAAARWIEQAAGDLTPERLSATTAERYGRDRTFAVPILMTCAQTGRLGDDPWRWVSQLPFELAACPHQWFRWLRLPVVSYALPALVAIGQVRHHHRPTRNPAARLLRDVVHARTTAVLERIQPASGGFLEAVPLTSFVVMAMAGSGRAEHPVARAGARFLERSIRPDGSWPIDTNLATWVTTLSVNALAAGDGLADILSPAERHQIRDWLLSQQWVNEHPYTHAAPGGWAWTNLSGGVPDADDTAGALLALSALGPADELVRRAAREGVRWLLSLQNADGGIPTFCRGWGTLPFDRSGTDLTAHAVRAWMTWRPRLPDIAPDIDRACRRALAYLRGTERADGTWAPLWFGNQAGPGEENPTYGTSRVLLALHATRDQAPSLSAEQARAIGWLLTAQNQDGGWGGAAGIPSSIEETALAVGALAREVPREARVEEAVRRGLSWLARETDCGRRFRPSPIGLYFARLWYSEELYPLILVVAALERVHSIGRDVPVT